MSEVCQTEKFGAKSEEKSNTKVLLCPGGILFPPKGKLQQYAIE